MILRGILSGFLKEFIQSKDILITKYPASRGQGRIPGFFVEPLEGYFEGIHASDIDL